MGDALAFRIWDKGGAPENPEDGAIYYLTADCPEISTFARTGQLWQCRIVTGSDLKQHLEWTEYKGELSIN